MGCLNSKEQSTKQQPPASTATTFNPPESVVLGGGATSQPQPVHQPATKQVSQLSGMGSPHNGSFNPPLPTVPSPVLEDEGSLFIARYAYQARTAEDLSFEKGEKLKVSCPVEEEGGWWWWLDEVLGGWGIRGMGVASCWVENKGYGAVG